MEALSGGCVPNSYMIRDRTAKWNAMQEGGPEAEKQAAIGQAFFIMKEHSDCWCRACCNPAQPNLVKFWNTAGPYDRSGTFFLFFFLLFFDVQNSWYSVTTLSLTRFERFFTGMGCGPCKMPDYQVYNPINNPVLTFEKGGNCDNCAQCGSLNCFVCCAKCQSHAWMHNGDVPSTYAPKKICCSTIDHWEFENTPGLLDNPRPNAFAHAVVPIRGGMCTPTVNVMERDQKGNEIEFAVVQGPTFFGGCMDLCCSTKFTVSRQGDKSADLALITKKNKDPGCMGLCVALCTPADTYNLDFAPGHNLTPTQKAAIVGEMIHLDFLFFEAGKGRNGLGWERGWERRCCFVFCAWIDFGVFFFFLPRTTAVSKR